MAIGLLVVFVVLLFANGDDLGLKGILLTLLFVGGALGVSLALDNPAPFTIAMALTDIALVLMLFGGDVRIR